MNFEFTKEYCLELLAKTNSRFYKNAFAYLCNVHTELVRIIMTREKICVSKGTWIGNINEVNYYLEVAK